MKVRTQTAEIREIRQIAIELLLANHNQQCPTCPKNTACQLQDVARKLGIARFVSNRSMSRNRWTRLRVLVRDPGKCVLCGDCVRFCAEITGYRAIDFAFRGQTPRCCRLLAGPGRGRVRQLRPVCGRLSHGRPVSAAGGGRRLASPS
jgi:NADH-quinone oxidoreductase subunit G